MLTGQNYGEGDSHANNVNQSVANPDSTVNSATQAASSFDEILKTPGLSDVGKSIPEGMNEKGNFTLDSLQKAAIFLASTPDSISPSEEVNGESLQSILKAGMKSQKQSVDEFLLSPELSETNRAILLELKLSGASSELIFKTAERLQRYYPTAATIPKLFKGSRGALSFKFDVLVNARGGNSAADIIAFALDEYREDRLKKAFNAVRDGEWMNAYGNFQDAEIAQTALFEMLLDATTLADKNYWATQGEEPLTNSDTQGYKHFLKNYLEIDPATVQQD